MSNEAKINALIEQLTQLFPDMTKEQALRLYNLIEQKAFE